MRLLAAISHLNKEMYKTDYMTRDAIETVLSAIEDSIDLEEWDREESALFPDLVDEMLRNHYKIVNGE
jgi:hypothetical protein